MSTTTADTTDTQDTITTLATYTGDDLDTAINNGATVTVPTPVTGTEAHLCTPSEITAGDELHFEWSDRTRAGSWQYQSRPETAHLVVTDAADGWVLAEDETGDVLRFRTDAGIHPMLHMHGETSTKRHVQAIARIGTGIESPSEKRVGVPEELDGLSHRDHALLSVPSGDEYDFLVESVDRYDGVVDGRLYRAVSDHRGTTAVLTASEFGIVLEADEIEAIVQDVTVAGMYGQ